MMINSYRIENITDCVPKPSAQEEVTIHNENAYVRKLFRKRFDAARGIALGFLLSIPIWIILGIVLVSLLK
jgi:hypothetical protein